jgi:CBS domain-containing protein
MDAQVKIKYLVKHVATRELITIDKKAKSREVIDLMLANDIGCTIITDNGKPVGIVTDRDVLKKGGLMEGKEITVGSYMSTPLITIDQEAPIGEAAELMMKKDIRRLIVTENDEIVGIVTQKDLLKGSANAFQVIRLMEM